MEWSRWRARAGLTFPLVLLSCHGCKGDHPFVPYSIDGETPRDDKDAEQEAAAALDAPDFGPSRVSVAPPGAATWTLDGLALTAPPGRVFALGVTGDFDGDGAADAVVVLKGAEPDGLGDVWVYRGSPAPPPRGSRVEGVPTLALAPSCSPAPRLARVGPHAVLVELAAECGERPATGVDRWLGVIDLRGSPRLFASARVKDPERAPRLTLDAESMDFDKDGRDDLLLRVTLEGGGPPFEPGPKVSAVVRWFDRPAGLSRDSSEPESSLRAIASSAMARAQKTKEAATVPLLVHAARELFVAICAEGKAPRLTEVVGDHPIRCGASHALEELALAETRAYVTMGDALGASAALDLAGTPPATRTAARLAEARGWIEKLAPPVNAVTLRAILAVPASDRARPPAWGALAFEPSGKLLVRTPAGVARVDPVQGDETDAAGVARWRSEVLSPDGARRFLDVYDACDAFALRATVAALAGNDVRDIDLPLMPRVGPRCEGARGIAVRATPIAWGPLGLEALAGGFPILLSPDLTHAVPLENPLGQPVQPGSPRSPDGKTLVVPVASGILVTGPHPRLLRAKELDGAYSELYDCAVSDDGSRVACIRGGRAFVGIWPGG
jgi:hypothetical protein